MNDEACKASIARIEARECGFLEKAIRWTAIVGAALAAAVATWNIRAGFGLAGGIATSLLLIHSNILFSRSVRPGVSSGLIRARISFINLFKYPLAAIVIFFAVRAGTVVTACFCLGFGLVYLVLTAMALASLNEFRKHPEDD